MKPRTFKEQTFILGAPQGWDATANGPCAGLPVLRLDEVNQWFSRWRPSWRERFALLFGRDVQLTVVGGSHPPVSLRVWR